MLAACVRDDLTLGRPSVVAEGFHAYNEFLLGLEKINQQEYVKPGFSGPKIHADKLTEFGQVRHD